MSTCDFCGQETALPFKCSHCGGSFCSIHRLPENHSCRGFAETRRAQGEKPYLNLSPDSPQETESWIETRYRIPEDESKGRRVFSGYPLFRLSTMLILLLLLLAFIGQLAAQYLLGSMYYRVGDYDTLLYYLTPSPATVLFRPWTLLTSIFLHAGFLHLFVNGFVLFSFGPVLEMKIGRRRFLYVFLGSGVIAGAAQLLILPPEVVVLGASGAILGVLGTLTVLAPKLPVLLFFLIPMPLWVATLGFGVLSAILAFYTIGGQIAHLAHLTGLVVGLACGYKLLREERRGYQHLLQFLNPLT
jgi:hypothetical protein